VPDSRATGTHASLTEGLRDVSGTPSSHVPPGLIKLGETPPLSLYARQLWQRRDFATEVARGEMRAQHLDTLLGNFWHLLNPMMLIGVYFLVFGVILGADRGVDNFIAFLSIGIFAYNFTQRSAVSGAATIVDNEGLIRSLQFPRALLPISAVLRETYAFGSAIVVIILVLLATGEPITPLWLLAAPALVLQVIFNIGMALFFARIGDVVRDVLNVIPYIFRIFFYLSGVLYSVDVFLPDVDQQVGALPLHELFVLNPFYVFISLPREYLMVSEEHAFVGEIWMSAAGWAVGMFVLGLLVFRAGEADYGRG
jgi:teichoic acid transport system permease protein